MKNKTLIIFSIISLFTVATASALGPTLGDPFFDYKIDIKDALVTAKYSIGISRMPNDFNLLMADVDASGDITIIDALLIAQFSVGFIDRFPAQPPDSECRFFRIPIITLGLFDN